MLEKLYELRSVKQAELDQLITDAGTRDSVLPEEQRTGRLNDEEENQFTALAQEVRDLDARIEVMSDLEQRAEVARQAVAKLPASPRGGQVERTYRKGGEASFVRDLMLRGVGPMLGRDQREIVAAAERLDAHMREERDLTRVDASAGELVPPLYLVDQYVKNAKAGRVTANRCVMAPLPGGTDSINVPRINTGTAVDVQTADNAVVAETDLATTNVNAPVRTIAGQQDVAIQLLDQSPIAFDQVIFMDLMGEHARRTDIQVISGTGAGNQVTGYLTAAGITVTYTDATPTVGELYPKIADAIQQISTQRFDVPTAIVMHPRRWYWFMAALDSSSRPLVTPASVGQGFTPLGTEVDVMAEGFAGWLQGLPVYIDPNIPINLGAGTNEDRILVAKWSDILLWESTLRSRVLPEVLSGNLTVRLQVYSYLAFMAQRYPTALATIAGTGLITPTF